MFINVIETDDLIRYGSDCSPVPPRFPHLGREGKRTGFPASRGLRAASSLLGSILHTLVQHCADVPRNLSKIYMTIALCAAGSLTPATHHAGARIAGFALCNSLYEAEFFLTTPFTLAEVLLEISLAPKTASV